VIVLEELIAAKPEDVPHLPHVHAVGRVLFDVRGMNV